MKKFIFQKYLEQKCANNCANMKIKFRWSVNSAFDDH